MRAVNVVNGVVNIAAIGLAATFAPVATCFVVGGLFGIAWLEQEDKRRKLEQAKESEKIVAQLLEKMNRINNEVHTDLSQYARDIDARLASLMQVLQTLDPDRAKEAEIAIAACQTTRTNET
eukprot:TRINITY_DN7860_c0_g2_i2.p3 TRINITY_DN7860_c0_g2~~TRINITY_DN7860_c0_g2_i2.p3  ORF type:complete len:135 (+),score=6.01 TRINITY_DN7860_c0_g2_i2:41-406(+)